ncbi:MAG TPA: hypothetical protein VFK05_24640 [Polyangiaceae bacterium]|nr:hypothetical protein [Polyangiaceae bacterium]
MLEFVAREATRRGARGLRQAAARGLSCWLLAGCCTLFTRAPSATTDRTQYAPGALVKIVLDNHSGRTVPIPTRMAVVERSHEGRWIEYSPEPADPLLGDPAERVEQTMASERLMKPCTTHERRLMLPENMPDGSYRVRLESWLTNVFSVRTSKGSR